MIRSLSSALTGPSSPSADIYLGWACAEWIATGHLQALAPTVFHAGRTLIVVRHTGSLRSLPSHERLIYVIDDDWRAGLSDATLPVSYRLKLALVEGMSSRTLETSADVVVVSSPRLRDRYRQLYPGKEIVALQPAWPRPAAPLPRDEPRTLAFLGARSHIADFGFLSPVLETVLSRYEVLRVTVAGNHKLPRHLREHPRVELLPALSWHAYRSSTRGRAFDIGLYPLLNGGFNAARSDNKLVEYDQHGAAVVASDTLAAAMQAAADGRCKAIPNDPGAWVDTLDKLIGERGVARAMAKRNREAIVSEARLAVQKAAWSALLGLATDPNRSHRDLPGSQASAGPGARSQPETRECDTPGGSVDGVGTRPSERPHGRLSDVAIPAHRVATLDIERY